MAVFPPQASNRQPKPALVAVQWTIKWAGFFGATRRQLRNRIIIFVTIGVEQDKQNLPLRFPICERVIILSSRAQCDASTSLSETYLRPGIGLPS